VFPQLRAAVESLRIERDGHRATVTVSVGVAIVLPTLERSPEGAVQLADEALYAAKRDGRNRVVVFERNTTPCRPASSRPRSSGATADQSAET
jgi:diguanylate cyclase (GGDEF)-like protein